MELREQMEKLAVLQTLDLKIRVMQREKDEIPLRLATVEDTFKKEEEQALGQRAELERLQKERRQKEKELEEEVDRVKKTEARVFEIKTNKEYQAVLKEIENAKKLNRQREEEILGVLERLEEIQRKVKENEKQLGEKRKDYEQQVAELQQRADAFEQKMATEVREKEKRQREIPPDLLSKYQMLLERRQGVAVARVVNGVCTACNMNMRPQLYIELQRQDVLIICPNCSRILYWENGVDKAKVP
jgi:uncharacterized protein